MVNPSFQIGQNIGAFEAKRMDKNEVTQKTQKDMSIIDKALKEAKYSKDPEVLRDTMTTIITGVSKENQPIAIKFLEDSMKRIDEQEKREKGIEAAQQGGYNYYDPAAVQVQNVKDRNKQQRLQQYGLGGGVPQQQGQMQGQPMSSQAQSEQVKGVAPQQRKFSKDELTRMHASPDIEIREYAKAISKDQQEEEKLSQKYTKATRDEQLLFHKESAKYEEELMKQRKIAKGQIETVKTLDKAIKSENINPSSIANMFKGLGPIGDKISEAVINKDQATLLASIPQLLEGWKEVFGVRLSDADLRLLQDKLPSIGKNPEANLAITKILKKYAEMTLLRSDIAKEIKDSNKGLRPLGYADQIEERFDDMVAPVKMINPRNGRVMEVPAYKVSDAINAGGKLA